MADYKLEQAVRARDNAYTRDTEESRRRTNQEEFQVGDILSLHGRKVEVISLEGFDGINHLIAKIRELQYPDRPDRLVKCTDLSHMCWGRPQWTPILAAKYQVGNFILIDTDKDGVNRAAVILELMPNCIVAQEYYANKQRTRWSPVWFTDDLGNESVKQKPPAGSTAKTMELQQEQIIFNGYIKGSMLSDETKRRLQSKGFDWALPPTKITSADNTSTLDSRATIANVNTSSVTSRQVSFCDTVQGKIYKPYTTPQHGKLSVWTRKSKPEPTHFMKIPFPTLQNGAPHWDQIAFRVTNDQDTGQVIQYLDVHEKYDFITNETITDICSKLPSDVKPTRIITRIFHYKKQNINM